MKYTFIVALFLASSSPIRVSDDCKGDWCNKGLPYDYDEPTLKKAQADNAKKTQFYNAAKDALEVAELAHAAATAAHDAALAADGAAKASKATALSSLKASDYLAHSAYSADEAAYGAAVHAKEGSLDAQWKAEDELVAKTLFLERKQRDYDAAKAAK